MALRFPPHSKMPPTSGDRECVTYAEGSTSVRLSLSGRRLAVESSDIRALYFLDRPSFGVCRGVGCRGGGDATWAACRFAHSHRFTPQHSCSNSNSASFGASFRAME